MWKRFFFIGLVVGVLGLGVGGVFAAGDFKLEIGWETTRVMGPVRGDGTIDYDAAMVEGEMRGVKAGDNAWPLVEEVYGKWVKYEAGVREEELDRRETEQDAAMKRVWKEGEFEDVAAWLKANEGAMALGVEASKKGRLSPERVVADRSPWELGTMREMAMALCARALMKEGNGDGVGAREDVAAVHRLARLAGQGPASICVIVSAGIEKLAFRTEMIVIQQASAEEGEKWIEGRVVVPEVEMAKAMDVGDRYELLKTVMLMIGGHYREGLEAATYLDLESMFTGKVGNEEIAAGDLGEVDWNVVLRRVNEGMDEEVRIMGERDFGKRREMEGAFVARLGKEKLPGVFFDVMSGALLEPEGGDMETRHKALVVRLETFVKRREGETVAAFSGRIAELILQRPGLKLMVESVEKSEVTGRLEKAAFGLEKYRLEHEDYPERLGELVPGYLKREALVDPFSGEWFVFDFRYRREGASGYVVYSVGENGVDDGGERFMKKDDIAVKGGRVGR